MTRFDIMSDLLSKSNYFKLVCGAGNENATEVRRLALIYTLAGANAFDVSASPEIVSACMDGIDLAYKHSEAVDIEIKVRPFITVSVGMPGDHHVRKAFILDDCVECGKCIPVCPTDAIPDDYKIIQEQCIGCGNCEAICPPKVAAVRYHHNGKQLADLLPTCLSAGAENIELHAAVPGDEGILDEWKIVSDAQPNNYVSMCLDRFHLSNMSLIERIRAAYAISGDRTLIQADGVPMSGADDDYNTTLQAVSIADIIHKNLKSVDKKFQKLPVLLSGGTNGKTADLARLCGVPYQGISLGTHARKIVKKWTSEDIFEDNIDSIRESLEPAKDLVARSLVH